MGVYVHPTAHIAKGAHLEDGVYVGPNSVVGSDVRIGANTVLMANVYVADHVYIGANNKVYPGVVIGLEPQDKSFKGEVSYVRIGDDNVIREYVTIHRATGEGNVTFIGNRNYIMAYSHIAHNCEVGNDVIIANYTGLSGYVKVFDYAVLGGMVGIHQFVRIGSYVMVGAYSKVTQDVAPFLLVFGNPAKIYGINVKGLERHGFSPQQRNFIKELFKIGFSSQGAWSSKLEKIRELALKGYKCAEVLYSFLVSASKRGILKKLSQEGTGSIDDVNLEDLIQEMGDNPTI